MTHHRARGRPARSSELCDELSWNQYRRLVRVRLRVRFTELHNLHNPLQQVTDACSPQTSTHTAVNPMEDTTSPRITRDAHSRMQLRGAVPGTAGNTKGIDRSCEHQLPHLPPYTVLPEYSLTTPTNQVTRALKTYDLPMSKNESRRDAFEEYKAVYYLAPCPTYCDRNLQPASEPPILFWAKSVIQDGTIPKSQDTAVKHQPGHLKPVKPGQLPRGRAFERRPRRPAPGVRTELQCASLLLVASGSRAAPEPRRGGRAPDPRPPTPDPTQSLTAAAKTPLPSGPRAG
uniref:Uncharacterized protein n=1 Tax=Rangifer tarandus platyrhynchus TaxID=3082113 RepID=A0ACB0EHD8_RANTA|nr:unnamed protein product [Rangifer tarandus platyrhynchus]